ncbi:MAG: murein biosynthesis integral membrane protein MurJ [candidate division KSB1 bacterium]|nr:murein biosynthesis integral membrane protein MurJ [candidate division KSB1 bacterium]MDZ7318564.1 murein biosynthesis integral membrane protein MurJ [candidate division KSB1 bacterium]MDZ7342544.1 murein biosynthesis integral membrane protein MurJ [candidate division KSB1 bacterium]
MASRITRNLIDLVTGTFVSRVLGFLRELVTAAYYGTNRAMDLFVIAFTIPTFFRHFLGEDVVERAFLPPFKKLISQTRYQQAWRLLSACFNWMVLVLIILTGLLYLIAPVVVKIIAPGLEPAIFPKAINMTYWILPFMLIIGLAAFVGSILNFFELNKIYSLAPAMLSIGVIIGVHFFRRWLGIYALPAGFLLGGLLELLIQVPFLWKREIRQQTSARYHPALDLREQEMRTIGRESGFILLKSLLDKSVEIVDRMLASFLITGSIASLWYAQRLIQLPVAIIGLSISRALVPYLTEKKALVQDRDFLAGIRLGITLNLSMVMPTVVLMVVMAQPIIGLVYQRGHFDGESTRLTAIAFWCYSLGLIGISLDTFFSRLFSIFQKNKIPFKIAMFTAALNVVLNLILVKTPLKHGGIALASSIAFSVGCVLLFYFLSREIEHQIRFREILSDFLKIGFNCLLMGIGVYLLYHHWLQRFLANRVHSFFLQQCYGLIVVGTLALILYLGLIFILGPEATRRRLFRRSTR